MINQAELLEDLTDAQRDAVTHMDGPLLILAAAGSGKTRVITRRVAYLIANDVPQHQLLAITFTNKAAGEMKSRVGDLMGRKLRDFGRLDQPWPMVCTFHSLCLRVLREYPDRFNLQDGFSIYDSSDQKSAVKEAVKLAQISSQVTPSVFLHAISDAKSKLLTPQQVAAESDRDFYNSLVAKVYAKYQQILQQNNALDFDDLLMRCLYGLRDHEDILATLQERFQYVMIDEYQDTNKAQYLLAHALADGHRNIAVVGDPDQSIYAWRGADIQNILGFERDYPDATVIKLEMNYRSTRRILAAASLLIAHNTMRKDKALITDNPDGERPTLLVCQDENDEGEQVAQRLAKLHKDGGVPWNDMAIFYRMNALSRVLERHLRSAGVPYQIARGVEFFGRAEIKDILAYLRVVANTEDAISLERIVNKPARGIGNTAQQKLQAYAEAEGMTMFNALEQAAAPGLSTRAVGSCRGFCSFIRDAQRRAEQIGKDEGSNVRDLVEYIVKNSGMDAYLRKIGDADQSELANVDELISFASEYDEQHPEGDLSDFLSQISLMSDLDQLRDGDGAVTLMTLHAAKGLEFDIVAMVGLEEGCLPHARARDEPEQMEEERRLCFVGITRARKQLMLSLANRRMVRGVTQRAAPSPFLREIGHDQFDVVDRVYGSSEFEDAPRPEYDDDPGFSAGQRVKHHIFGVGTVQDLRKVGNDWRIIVDFQSRGRKTLVLAFAKLEAL